MKFAKIGSNSEFQRVYHDGRSKANKYLVMYVVKGQSGLCRYGFSVSKKVGNSVVRHRVTRVLRESVRQCGADVTEGCSIVIIARPEAKDMGTGEISQALISLYRAHHIWKGLYDEESAT